MMKLNHKIEQTTNDPGSNRIMRIAMALLLTLVFAQFSYAVTGPGASWLYVRKITLSSPTPSANFQVKVTLTTAIFGNPYTHIRADGNDILFYDGNNISNSYYLDTWTNAGTSTIWVKVPTAGTSVLYMYYGNGSVTTAASSGDNTFIFFDDFNASSLNATKWSSTTVGASGSSISEGSGNVTLTSGGCSTCDLSGAQIIGKTSFNVTDGVIVETHLGAAAPQNTGSRGSLCGASDRTPASGTICYFDAGPLTNWAITTTARGGTFGHWFEQCNGALNDILSIDGTSSPSTLPIGDFLSVAFTAGKIYYSSSNPLSSTNSTLDPPTGTLYPILSTAHNSTIHNAITIAIDYIRLRKFLSTGDITGSFGSEVTNNLNASITAPTNVLCNGQSTGAATVNATGGATPYTYSWSPSGGTSATASSLAAGTYTVTVTDNIGLTATASATITQPASAVSGSIGSQTNILCNGLATGSVTVAGSGGVGPYTYALGAGTYGGSGTFSSLAATNYTVHVKDVNGCIFDQAVTITQPATAVTSTVISQSNITCFSTSTGTIVVGGSGGTGTFTFSINNGGSYQASDTFNNLPAGVYQIRVKDSNGCESKQVQ